MSISSDFLLTALTAFPVDPQKQTFFEVSAPGVEPITVAEAKTFARINTASEDTLIGALITASRIAAEKYCNRIFIERTMELFLDHQPMSFVVEFPVSPVSAVSEISSFAQDDTETTFAATKYRTDLNSTPPRIVLKDGQAWPTGARNVSSFRVQFTAGYGTASTDVPGPILEAIKVIFAHLWELRGQIEEGVDKGIRGSGDLVGRLPLDAVLLLSPYRVDYLE